MMGDASVAGNAYPVDAPGLAPPGLLCNPNFFLFLNCHSAVTYEFWLICGYATFTLFILFSTIKTSVIMRFILPYIPVFR